jgi:hypothetical protein
VRSIETLRRGVREWLVEHELAGDIAFYTPEEWQAREEPYLAGAGLLLVFSGGLYSVMNGYREDSIALCDEFEQFVRGFGYFFELGHAWSMGFYPLPARRLQTDLRIYSAQT